MNNKILLESVALDLKRVALGAHSNSTKMTERFLQEVYKRNELVDKEVLSSSCKKVLSHMKVQLKNSSRQRLADDALLYSTLILSFSKQLQ